MGLLRLYLALAVLNSHHQFWPTAWTSHFGFASAGTAVCGFYIVSGFYMAMIVDTKYSLLPDGTLRFFVNRALRLFPVYFAVLLFAWLTIEFLIARRLPGIVEYPNILSIDNPAATLGERVLGFLQNGTLIFGPLFKLWPIGKPAVNPYWQVIPQMYTVGIELTFYLFAVLLARLEPKRLVLLTIAFAAVHFSPWLLIGLRISHPSFFDPNRAFQYDFVPGVFVYFLMGQVSYLIGKTIIPRLSFDRRLGWIVLPTLIIYISATQFLYTGGISYTNAIRPWVFYLALMVLIPILFEASRRNEADNRLGELSYPIYVCHFPIIAVAIHILGHNHAWSGMIVLAAVVVVSILLLVAIERPMAHIRERVANGAPVKHGTATAFAR